MYCIPLHAIMSHMHFLIGFCQQIQQLFLTESKPVTWSKLKEGKSVTWTKLKEGKPVTWTKLKEGKPVTWSKLKIISTINITGSDKMVCIFYNRVDVWCNNGSMLYHIPYLKGFTCLLLLIVQTSFLTYSKYTKRTQACFCMKHIYKAHCLNTKNALQGRVKYTWTK